jgi:hypothetical protein
VQKEATFLAEKSKKTYVIIWSEVHGKISCMTGREITAGQRTMSGQNGGVVQSNSYLASHFDLSLSVKEQTNFHLN